MEESHCSRHTLPLYLAMKEMVSYAGDGRLTDDYQFLQAFLQLEHRTEVMNGEKPEVAADLARIQGELAVCLNGPEICEVSKRIIVRNVARLDLLARNFLGRNGPP